MTVELTMLVYSVALTFLLIMIPAAAGMFEKGVPWAVGNRDTRPSGTAFSGRALRARNNMFEAMAIFTPLVLVGYVSGAFNAEMFNYQTALGAQIFFYSRLAHAGLYMAGIPWLRTAAWLGGVFGSGIILWELI